MHAAQIHIQTQDLVYEWKLNGAVQSGKDKVFKVPRKPVWKSVSCEVSNKAGKESSVASEAKCIGRGDRKSVV